MVVLSGGVCMWRWCLVEFGILDVQEAIVTYEVFFQVTLLPKPNKPNLGSQPFFFWASQLQVTKRKRFSYSYL